MIGRIMDLSERFDEVECKIVYEVKIWFVEKPKLFLGEVEVSQEG